MMQQPEEEIHFLVDDITEHLNQELQSVLQQIKDPSAKKRIAFVNTFTRALVKAAAPKRKTPYIQKQGRAEAATFNQYVQDVRTYAVHHPVQPQHFSPPTKQALYYTNILAPQQQPQTKIPQPRIQQQPQEKKEPLQEQPTEKKILPKQEQLPPLEQQVQQPLPQEASSDINIQETLHVDFSKESPLQQEPSFLEPEQKHIALIKESETKQTVVFAQISNNQYHVLEPLLTEEELQVLEYVRKAVLQNNDVAKDKVELYKLIASKASQLNKKFQLSDEGMLLKIRYYIIRDFFNLGQLEPLLHDGDIEKIICEGVEKPITVIRNGQQMQTNIVFSHQEEINGLLQQVAKKTYQQLSLEEPILDATYKEFRIQGNLGTEMVPAKFIIMRG